MLWLSSTLQSFDLILCRCINISVSHYLQTKDAKVVLLIILIKINDGFNFIDDSRKFNAFHRWFQKVLCNYISVWLINERSLKGLKIRPKLSELWPWQSKYPKLPIKNSISHPYSGVNQTWYDVCIESFHHYSCPSS